MPATQFFHLRMSTQKAKILEVAGILQCTQAQAEGLLKRNGWDTEVAIGYYYETGMPAELVTKSAKSQAAAATGGKGAAATKGGGAGSSSASTLEGEYARFENTEAGGIDGDGLEKLFGELGVDMYADPVALVICYHAKCHEAGMMTKDEFVRGMGEMGVDSIAQLKAKIPTLRAQLDHASFVKGGFWAWAYSFNCDLGQKTISKDAAVPLVELLISEQKWPLRSAFTEFLSSLSKTFSKDSWSSECAAPGRGSLGLHHLSLADLVPRRPHARRGLGSNVLSTRDLLRTSLASRDPPPFPSTLCSAAGAGLGAACRDDRQLRPVRDQRRVARDFRRFRGGAQEKGRRCGQSVIGSRT